MHGQQNIKKKKSVFYITTESVILLCCDRELSQFQKSAQS